MVSDQVAQPEEPKFKYKPKTDEEIKELAKAIWAGQVFTSMHLKNPEDTSRVFMILGLMSGEQIKSLQDERISFVYEYLDEAGPRSINGLPMFLSAKYLNVDDHQRVDVEYNKILEVMGRPPGARQGDSDARTTEANSGEGDRPTV